MTSAIVHGGYKEETGMLPGALGQSQAVLEAWFGIYI